MEHDRKKILLAVDGSNQSFNAVRYASGLFSPGQTEFVLFYVMSKVPEVLFDFGEDFRAHHPVFEINRWEKELERSINQFMEKSYGILLEAGVPGEHIQIKIRGRKAGIARDIIAETDQGYSAVIFGRHGEGVHEEWIIGSVANKIIERLSKISVCAVGGQPESRKILLALDGSENAMRAVEFVGSMFAGAACQVTLFYVLRGLNIYQKRYEDIFHARYEEEWREAYEIESVFEMAKVNLVKHGLDTSRLMTKLVPGASSRSGAIIQEAREGGYGSVVVGRRGVSTVQEFLMGRVCHKVIHSGGGMAAWVIA